MLLEYEYGIKIDTTDFRKLIKCSKNNDYKCDNCSNINNCDNDYLHELSEWSDYEIINNDKKGKETVDEICWNCCEPM